MTVAQSRVGWVLFAKVHVDIACSRELANQCGAPGLAVASHSPICHGPRRLIRLPQANG